MTKGFSYYVFDLMLDYDADIDRATAVLRRIDEELRADDAWRSVIIDPLDVLPADAPVLERALHKRSLDRRPTDETCESERQGRPAGWGFEKRGDSGST